MTSYDSVDYFVSNPMCLTARNLLAVSVACSLVTLVSLLYLEKDSLLKFSSPSPVPPHTHIPLSVPTHRVTVDELNSPLPNYLVICAPFHSPYKFTEYYPVYGFAHYNSHVQDLHCGIPFYIVL